MAEMERRYSDQITLDHLIETRARLSRLEQAIADIIRLIDADNSPLAAAVMEIALATSDEERSA